MKFRLLSLVLALALLFSMGCVTALAVNREDDPLFNESDGQVDHDEEPDDYFEADEDITIDDLNTSADGVDFIKDYEGFTASAYHDVSQMSIGYGCSTAYAEKYGFDTEEITQDEADQLILYVIAELEQKLDRFLEEYDISLSQTEYDALVSFTFNVGSSWLNADYRLASLLIDGDYTVNEFASAMGVWCHVGTEINSGLIVRRIGEIKLFLYGAYALDDTPNKFCYLIYDGNGGSPQADIAFYLEDAPYEFLFSAEHETQDFQGWFTADGEEITEDTVVTDDLTVYADWGDGIHVNDDVDEDAPETDPEPVDLTKVFTDVAANGWYYGYVHDLYIAKVIDGYGDHTFRPDRTVTTGEALKMILLAAGYEEPEPVASHWARGYLNLALEEGIIQRGDITDLDVPMSRGMMAKVVANAMGLRVEGNTSPYSDTEDYYVVALYENQIADGYPDGTFRPSRSLTRAEISTIVWRMLEY